VDRLRGPRLHLEDHQHELFVSAGFISRLSRLKIFYRLAIILVRRAAPDKRVLGSTYGVSQTIACVARSVGPAFVR